MLKLFFLMKLYEIEQIENHYLVLLFDIQTILFIHRNKTRITRGVILFYRNVEIISCMIIYSCQM